MQKLQICQTDSSPQENEHTVKKKTFGPFVHFFLLRAICSIKPDRSPRTCGLNLTRRGAETLAQLGLIETAPSDSSPGLVIFAAWFVCVSARGQAVRERARRLAQAGWLVRLVGDRRPFRAMSAHMNLRVSCQFQRLQPARGTREGEVVASQPHDAGPDSDSGRFFFIRSPGSGNHRFPGVLACTWTSRVK